MKLRLHSRETVIVAAGLALAGTAAFHVPANASSPVHQRVQTTAGYSDSVPGSYIVGAENTDATNPFNDYGVEGKVSNDVGGVGVLGYGQQSKSYGVYGVTFGSNGIGVYGAGDGATPAPGATPNSATETTGVAGDAHGGNGVFGSTEWQGGSDPILNAVAGVYGVDNANGGDNDGVYGMTNNGGFGVAGYAPSTAIAGVGGGGGVTLGVLGTSNSNYGIYGTSNTNVGVVGYSPSYIGILGQSGDVASIAVEGQNMGGGPGVEGTSATGNGVFATSNETTLSNASLLATGGKVTIESIASTALASSALSFPILAYSSDGMALFAVRNTGETDVEGNLLVHGTTGTYARTRDTQVALHEYTPSSSRPTTEDIGQGRVVNGVAFVRLDPTFAAGIDSTSPYAVFVTPNGDTKGFYVTGKSLTGFTVRETQGGRSTWDFDYRVVATQFGQAGQRMAMVREADSHLAPRRQAFVTTTAAHALKSVAITSAKELAVARSLAKPGARHTFVARPNLGVEHRSQ